MIKKDRDRLTGKEKGIRKKRERKKSKKKVRRETLNEDRDI